MNDKIKSMAEYTHDARYVSVEQMADRLKELCVNGDPEDGAKPAKAVVAIQYDDGSYGTAASGTLTDLENMALFSYGLFKRGADIR